MQEALNSLPSAAPAGAANSSSPNDSYQIIRRSGAVVAFEPKKIAVALTKAFLAVHGAGRGFGQRARHGRRTDRAVVRALVRSRPGGGTFHIEDVQDQVELGLMRGGHHDVARAYVLYRERRAQERAEQPGRRVAAAAGKPVLHVTDNGQRVPLDEGAAGLIVAPAESAPTSSEPILAETLRNLYDGVPMDEVYKAAILAARTLIEKDPAYTYATARLLLHTIRKEILGAK
jgi:ribonucleoside-diphosphate reductase alpha chain